MVVVVPVESRMRLCWAATDASKLLGAATASNSNATAALRDRAVLRIQTCNNAGN